MSPSLKYLMVSSIAARNASSDPMSLTATLGVELACVLLVMCRLAPDADKEGCRWTRHNRTPPQRPGDELSGDRNGAHDDIAQRSEYESKAGGSIAAGYNTASVPQH